MTGAQGQRVRSIEVEAGVRLSVTEAGAAGVAPTVVLLHGFADLAYTWRRQIPVLAAAGYHVLAPDGRGYGRSSRPDDVDAYDVEHLIGDLVALLDDAAVERAVFVGHDWGALIVYALALLAPERVAGAVGIGVPFLPRGTVPPTSMLRQFAGEQWFLLLWVQEPGVAERDLERDVRRTLRRLYGGLRLEAIVGSQHPGEPRNFVDRLAEPQVLPDWLGADDLDHYVAEYQRTGFTGGLNWFRNFDRNWTLTPELAGARLAVPTLYLTGAADPLLIVCPPALMEGWVDDHRGTVLIDYAGHWVHQERPDAVNDALLWFLSDVLPVAPEPTPDPNPAPTPA
jgi:pimeloyl-ACP methyl ester carboxylesterase